VSFLRKRLHEDEHHRAQTIAMQQSRFIFQLVAGQHRIDGDHGCPDTLDNNNKKGLWEHPNKAIEAFTPARQRKWQQVDPALSQWQSFLLEHAL